MLVVEDDADGRETLVELLNGSGFTALGAASGKEALKVMVERSPTLVICDVTLGNRDGGELLDMTTKLLGSHAPPFVFVTGMPASHISGIPVSAAVLTKPLNVDSVLNVVGRYCLRAESVQTAL